MAKRTGAGYVVAYQGQATGRWWECGRYDSPEAAAAEAGRQAATRGEAAVVRTFRAADFDAGAAPDRRAAG